MRVRIRRVSVSAAYCVLLCAAIIAPAYSQEISASPSSLAFPSTYVGKATGSKALTVNLVGTTGVVISAISFSCPGFGLSSGVAPFGLGKSEPLTHYSLFFQPTAAQVYNCNFVITLQDGTFLNVPITGTGLKTTATASVSPASMNFANQAVGTTSAPRQVTITNNGGSTITLSGITLSPPSFTTSAVTLPASIGAGKSLTLSVFYTPSEIKSESGALDLTYNSIPDNGVSLSGNGVAAAAFDISTSPTLPQATQSAAYQATLATSGAIGPYSWNLASGSTLPVGLTLSSTGVISGTIDPSVAVGNYSFTVQATDSSSGSTANSQLTLGVFANLADNCNDISFDVPNTTTPMVALTDLGTGTYQGSEGGLYPNGSNVRPAAQDSYGVSLAQSIQPLDSNGNPSPTGKYVLLALGESTLQNEFNRFLPIANADPSKNPNLVIVNGAQGGATPFQFSTLTSAYWNMVLNNYLTQNNVTAHQVVAAVIEDTDGIASGTFPTDITVLQSEYENMMNEMVTLFPNLKMVYFSSRVYGGYSNGVGNPDNPEPYAYEVGYAVKWAIQDQLNGNANLNYNPLLGPVKAPWMSWGTYYWSNGMLGRSDGLVWNCADFSADGTHPSSAYGQLQVATALLNFLKTDDTTIPWYLAPSLALTSTAGNNQTGTVGTVLPTALAVLASNLNGGAAMPGVSVTFSDGGAGGVFGTPVAITGSNGIASTTYTLPAAAETVAISASSAGYASASFSETATNVVGPVLALTPTSGNNQSGGTGTTLPTVLTVVATSSGTPVSGVSVTFNDGGAGGSFGTPTAITGTDGTASTTYTLPPTAQIVTISATSPGYPSATFTETADVLALSPTAGNNQSGSVGSTLPAALIVFASSSGAPVQGVSVIFSDGGAGGIFGTPSAITGADGTASTTYTLPATAGTISITASSAGYTSASFTENATISALTATAGNNQSGPASTILPTALTVLASNSGVPAPGVSVTFSDGGAGGTFGTPTAITGSNGTALTTYTLPANTETVTITATSAGYTAASFTETATPNVASLALVSGSKQVGTVGTTLPLPIVVRAKNSSGKPAVGAPITFADGGLGSFSPNPAITGTNGEASTVFTLPTIVKSIAITAADGSFSLSISAKSLVGPPSAFTIVSGNNQSALPGKTLPKKLVVSLADQYGNPISGTTVTFSDNGAGGTFSSTSAITASTGRASVSYTTGSQAETVTITASTSGLTSLNFTETVK
jgi:hypothetical protein